jgi:hypothetical protein
MAKKHPKEIGLSDDHVTQLEVFIDTYSSKMGIALRTYLECLAINAAAEKSRYNIKKGSRLRSRAIMAFENQVGRKPSAEDLIQELSAVTSIPAYIAEAIRRDMARLAAKE